jgi:hypothetical protein
VSAAGGRRARPPSIEVAAALSLEQKDGRRACLSTSNLADGRLGLPGATPLKHLVEVFGHPEIGSTQHVLGALRKATECDSRVNDCSRNLPARHSKQKGVNTYY